MTTAIKRILVFIVLALGLLYVCVGMNMKDRKDPFVVLGQKAGFPFVYREYRAYGAYFPVETSYNKLKLAADLAIVAVISVGVPLLIFRKKKKAPIESADTNLPNTTT